MGLQLRIRGCRVTATVAYVRSLASMRTLVVVFRLVRGKSLVAAFIATGIRPIAGVAEEVA